MRDKLRGIVLSVVRYNDRYNIARVYTDGRGMMSFLVHQGTTPAARARRAMFMPLSLLEFECSMRAGGDISTLHDVRRYYAMGSIYGNPYKSAIAMFMSEVVARVIQEHERNEGLFSYLEQSVKLLEQKQGSVANFHICFLYHLGALMGIEPDVATYRDGYWFDADGGVFRPAEPRGRNRLRPAEARIVAMLARMTFANMDRFRFTRDERNRVLDAMLAYFRIHGAIVGTLKSPDVLRQLFV